MNSFYVDFLDRLEELHTDILETIADLPDEALDWSPDSQMNTINVLVAHIFGAERYWIGDVAAQDPSSRNRDAEFRTRGLNAATLKKLIDSATIYARAVCSQLTPEDLTKARISTRDQKSFTIGWCLLHALEHTALHTGHIQVMRSLWESRIAAE